MGIGLILDEYWIGSGYMLDRLLMCFGWALIGFARRRLKNKSDGMRFGEVLDEREAFL